MCSKYAIVFETEEWVSQKNFPENTYRMEAPGTPKQTPVIYVTTGTKKSWVQEENMETPTTPSGLRKSLIVHGYYYNNNHHY
jgi:hypothetical protein